MMDLTLTREDTDFATEVREWLAGHLGEVPAFAGLADEVAWGRTWQATMAADRWVGIHWPARYGGRDATPVQVALYQAECARAGAPQPVNRVGINLVGPTLLAHGSDEQCRRWMPSILSAEELWCQLFSEPDAGSDLGSLATRAVPVDGGYLVTGQKVWTSYAQFAEWGLCLAVAGAAGAERAGGGDGGGDGEGAGAAGAERAGGGDGEGAGTEGGKEPRGRSGSRPMSVLAVDMHAAGVEIRPLVQLTGDAEFNEVFLDEVFVPDDCLIGAEGHGWSVASSTLAHERGTNFPVKEQAVHEAFFRRIWQEATESGAIDDPVVADALAGAYIDLAVLRLHNQRTLTRLGRGEEPGAESSWVKLAWTSMTQRLSEAALVAGGRGGAEALATPWARQWLWSRAASIAGGTSQVQRDIIARRILGLPR